MGNTKTLAIAATLGLGLIFSAPLVAAAQEAQTGGLPALEDRVTADEALIAEIETDLGELQTQITTLKGAATKTFVFNDKPELSSTGTIVVSGPQTVTVGEFDGAPHRLLINYSSVGAIEGPGAILFIGCFVDGPPPIPCVGTQADPSTTPAGWVNVLSTDFPGSTAWDNSVDHVWYTATKLSAGTHTVTIKAAVGNPLVPFLGTGTLFDEARTLVVTVLGAND